MVSGDGIFPGEGAVEIVEITTKYLESGINLVDKASTRFDRISSVERSSAVAKVLSDSSVACYREIVHLGKSRSMQQTSLLS